MTPGWRKVRSFLTAFLAIGRRDLFAGTSKENILQFDPSSWSTLLVVGEQLFKYRAFTLLVPL